MRMPVRWSGAVIAALVTGLVGTACGPGAPRIVTYAADWPFYDSVAALYAAADVVVQGRVTRAGVVREVPLNDDGDTEVCTLADITVEEVYKGAVEPGATIVVRQLGGLFDGTRYVADRVVHLRLDERYVLFLATFEDVSPSVPAATLNPSQGQYEVAGSGDLVSLDGNPLTVTVAELRELAAG